MRRLLLAYSAFLLLSPFPCSSQSPPWEPAGFGGAGNFLAVHFDPGQADLVYALSDVAGVLRSTDGGDHWEIRSSGLGNYEISSFAVDPLDSNTLYAGVGAFPESEKAGIYISRDAGVTWFHLGATFTNHIAFRKYRTADAIAASPESPGTVLAGSRDNGIWLSANYGVSWSQVYTAPMTYAEPTMLDGNEPAPVPPFPAPVAVVLYVSSKATTAYAGFDGAGVVKSPSGGTAGTWQNASTGLPNEATVKDLAVNGTTLYAAVGLSGVYKSTDGAGSWQAANGGLPIGAGGDPPWVSSVEVHPQNAAVAWITLTTFETPSVWKTANGGATWTQQPTVHYDPLNNPTNTWASGETYSWKITCDPHNPDRLFFADFWGIHRSVDGGTTWVDRIIGAQNTCVTDLYPEPGASPSDHGILWATHMDAGILFSPDGGTSWETALPTVWDETVTGHYWAFEMAGTGALMTYFATCDPWDGNLGKVFRSVDGENWTPVFQNARPTGEWMGGAMLGLAADPGNPNRIYVTQDGGQVWRSTSGGDPGSWAPTAGQPADRSFTYALAVDYGGRIFAGTLNDGLWRSENDGASWSRVLPDIATVFRVVAVPGAVYATGGENPNLFKSTNGGDSWVAVTNFTQTPDSDGVGPQGMAFAVDPNDSQHLLYSRVDTWHPLDAGPGVYESLDGGTTWAAANQGLGQTNAQALAIGYDGTAYAGTWCAGIWRRPATQPLPPGTNPLPLNEIKYWGYQIQSVSAPGAVQALADTRYDMLVLEPTRTDWSSDDLWFDTVGMVDRLKRSPANDGTHRKLVIAYIDIGEAEDWRWYWTWSKNWNCQGSPPGGWPDYILACDPDGWGGNYPVAYWDPLWRDITLDGLNQDSSPFGNYRSIVDEVVKAGFDGVYLDWVEGFENQAVIAAATAAGKDAATEMVNFIQDIKNYGTAKNGTFLVIQQNAAALLDNHPELLNHIDGIAQEEIWYGGIATDNWDDPQGYDDPIDPQLTQEYIGWLDQYLNAGITVFNCEYALNFAPQAYAQSYAKGYVPYCTRRSLSKLSTTPPAFDCGVGCTAGAAPQTGAAPLTVNFTATATPSGCTGTPTYTWDFGDGSGSAAQNPSHEYTAPGTYTWTLTVLVDAASCTQTGTVTVTQACSLTCSASATPTSGTAPLQVAFSASGTPANCSGQVSYAWTFGDGETSNVQNPNHTYTSAGIYNWAMTATVDGVTCMDTGAIGAVDVTVPGDCNGDGTVSIGEVQRAINMFLGVEPPDCGVDGNSDGSVSIGEVQKVINAFLGVT